MQDSFPAKRFLARSKLRAHQKRVDRAKSVIEQALSMDLSWYVACSGGKDSVALAHMVNEICPGIEIWSVKDEFDFPGEREFMEDLAEKYSWNLKIVSPPGGMRESLGNICEDLHSRGTSFSDKFFYTLITEQEKHFDGVFLGLRNGESNKRRLNFLRRGFIYQKTNKVWTSCPISLWSGEDVFAYLVAREIPVFEIYYKTAFHDGDPCKIRKSWYLPSARASSGQAAWLKYYYPDLYMRLLEIDPGVASYG